MMRRAARALVLAVSVSDLHPGAAQNRAEDVLARAAAYTAAFVDRFTNVVAEERYVQDARPVAVAGRGKARSCRGRPTGNSCRTICSSGSQVWPTGARFVTSAKSTDGRSPIGRIG